MAVSESNPEFSWKLQAASLSLHSVRQSSYQIRVAANISGLLAGTARLWDSGKVSSSRSATANHPYAGAPLQPQHDYFWQVRVWDEADHPSSWSSPTYWIQAPVWRAQWIGAVATDAEANNKPLPLLRKSVDLSAHVSRAILYVSGLGQYEFRINGSKVGNDELTPDRKSVV